MEQNNRVNLGLSLSNRAPLFGWGTIDELLEITAFAEKCGVFDSVWFGDSLVKGPRFESIVMLSAAATLTRKVRLGVCCLASFPLRHPVLLAIQWATLDQLSKGRMILAACNGTGEEPELRAFGIARNERISRVEEGISLLRQMWADKEIKHHGQHYTLDGYDIQPKPSQRPCPIWIAVNPKREQVGDRGVERAMRRVARLGDGFMTTAVTHEEYKRRWALIQEEAGRIGRDLNGFETSIHWMVNINDNKRAAYKESKFYFDNYYSPSWPPQDTIKIWLAHGGPRECAEMIQSWIDVGITTPILRFTARDQMRQIRRFIDEILPLLSLERHSSS